MSISLFQQTLSFSRLKCLLNSLFSILSHLTFSHITSLYQLLSPYFLFPLILSSIHSHPTLFHLFCSVFLIPLSCVTFSSRTRSLHLSHPNCSPSNSFSFHFHSYSIFSLLSLYLSSYFLFHVTFSSHTAFHFPLVFYNEKTKI